MAVAAALSLTVMSAITVAPAAQAVVGDPAPIEVYPGQLGDDINGVWSLYTSPKVGEVAPDPGAGWVADKPDSPPGFFGSVWLPNTDRKTILDSNGFDGTALSQITSLPVVYETVAGTTAGGPYINFRLQDPPGTECVLAVNLPESAAWTAVDLAATDFTGWQAQPSCSLDPAVSGVSLQALVTALTTSTFGDLSNSPITTDLDAGFSLNAEGSGIYLASVGLVTDAANKSWVFGPPNIELPSQAIDSVDAGSSNVSVDVTVNLSGPNGPVFGSFLPGNTTGEGQASGAALQVSAGPAGVCSVVGDVPSVTFLPNPDGDPVDSAVSQTVTVTIDAPVSNGGECVVELVDPTTNARIAGTAVSIPIAASVPPATPPAEDVPVEVPGEVTPGEPTTIIIPAGSIDPTKPVQIVLYGSDGSTITVEATATDNGDTVSVEFEAPAGLEPGTDYTLALFGTGTDGSTVSTSAPITTSEDLREAPALPATAPTGAAELQVSPSSVTAGQTVTVTAPELSAPPGSQVRVGLYSAPVELAVLTADSSGGFTTQVTIPADTAAGEHQVVAAAYTAPTGTDVGYFAGTVEVAAIPTATRPGAPTDVTATGRDRSIDVSWTAPANGGSPITGYTATAAAGLTSRTCTATAARNCTITGLTNGTTYTVTVTATNAQGEGPASAPVTATPRGGGVTPGAVPGAPTGVTATAGAESATVSWRAPTDTGGSAITGYQVTAYDDNGGVFKRYQAAGNRTSLVVEPLPAQAFTFDVAAVNDAGTGPASRKTEPVLVGTPPAAPAAPDRLPARADSTLEPMAPADPGADVDVTSATGVAWPGSEANAALFAAGDDSAGPIPGVTDTLVANADGTITGTVTLPDDLAPGSYILAVSYLNPQGEAQVATGPLVVGQPVGVPAAPTDVAATGGTLTATVTWKAPTDTGDSPITGYTVTTYTQGGAVFGTSQAGARATSLQLTDLAAGTYSFDVRAVNAAGSSAASSRSNTVTVTAPATTPPPATGGGSTGGGSGGSSTTGGTPTGIPGGEGATAPQLAPQAATGTRGLALAGLGMMLAAGLFLVRRRSGPGSIR